MAEPEALEAFINIPYHDRYEKLFLAYMAGCASFGLEPTAAVYLPANQTQQERICKLIGRATYSFHDLSWVGLDHKPPRVPRFNMAFELGLASARELLGGEEHYWFVFEAVQYRFEKSLSDLKGTNAYIHSNKPETLFEKMLDALADKPTPYAPNRKQMIRLFNALCLFLPEVRTKCGKDIFRTAPFHMIRLFALKGARNLREGARKRKV